MAVRKLVSLLIVAVVFAAISFSSASALDLQAPHDVTGGRKFLSEVAERTPLNTVAAKVSASSQVEQNVEFTGPGTFSKKPSNTPEPLVGPDPDSIIANGETSIKIEGPTGEPTSVIIASSMDVGNDISVRCYSSGDNEPPVVLAPQHSFAIAFGENPYDPWLCDFAWVGTSETASFTVWTHDGTPILSDCNQCNWRVQKDGFYILSVNNGVWVNLHSWNQIGNRIPAL